MESSLSNLDLGGAELPASAGGVMQSEPCGGRVLADNGCSTDTINYTSCPNITRDCSGGIDSSCDDEGEDSGDGMSDDNGGEVIGAEMRVGAVGGNVRKGKGGTPCIGWTKEERSALWECFEKSGGVRKGGYIKRTKEMYESLNLTPRSGPSLVAQLNRLEGGGMTEMEKGEIRQKVRTERIVRKVEEGIGLEQDEIDEVFGESFGEDDEWIGFADDQANEDRRTARTDMIAQKVEDGLALEQDEIDQLFGESFDDAYEWTGFTEGEIREGDVNADTWRGLDGQARQLVEEEREVLSLLRRVRDDGTWKDVPNLRAIDRRMIMKEVGMVDGVMHNLLRQDMNITDVNRLMYAGSAVVALRLGLKLGQSKKAEVRKPWWQRRIEQSIEVWRRHLSQVEEIRNGKVLGEKVRKELEAKYDLTERGALSVSTFLKNKIQAGSTKIRWYVEKKVARRQNNLYRNNQRQLYKELSGDAKGRTDEYPDATESREFWNGIWAVETEHDREASWLESVRKQMGEIQRMEDVKIKVEDVKKGIGRMANWKAPGPDMVRGFWFKKFQSLHDVLTDALKECMEQGDVPEWMVKGRTVLFQKDPLKGNAASNYRPIACLPLMWKLLTGILADKIYDHLQMNRLLPDEQKGCRRKSRGTKDQLLIDREVLREAKRKKRHLAMAWIDYRKAYDMLPHSWILETLEMMKISKNIGDFLRRTMTDWKTVLTAGGKVLGEVDIKRGIFQGDTLSPLLFVIAMIPLTILLRRESIGYRFGESGRKINHLLFMDDLKLFGKTFEETEALCNLVYRYSKDIGMEFGMDKCAAIEIRGGMKVRCEGISLPDGKVMKEVEDDGYKYLGVLEGADMMTKEMKGRVRSEYLRRVRLVARSKLYARSLIGAMNAWAVSVVRYSAGILDWREQELKALDVKTRKILTMNGALHMRSSVDRLYLKRSEGGRGLISVEECVRKEELGLAEYVCNSEEWMLQVVKDGMSEEFETKAEFEKRTVRERWERLREKKLHGKFFNEVKDVADPKSWQWLRGGFVDKRTEGFVCAAQENVLPTRLYRATVMKDGTEKMCRLCGKNAESIGHLVSYCEKLRQTEFRRRHDKMGLRVYWEVCGELGLKRSERWYEEVPDPVRKSADGRYEVWWDQKVNTPTALDHNKPDVVLIDREEKKWTVVDFAVPFDSNAARKETEKMEKYENLAAELRRMHGVRVEVVPIVVGTLGVVTKNLVGFLKRLGVGDVVGGLQTAAVIGTAAILRKVLST